ncbi:MAG: pimeloyl-ACP methyl ester carboxylesterase [Myxococcota bacterium]|jgi:pimeloyl-ACP methyl ester carboxylesterase
MSHSPRLKTAHTVLTTDGWQLLLYRDRPQAAHDAVPVLLIHGLASTPDCWYGGRTGGIGTALAESGRDVWSLELRGGPHSQHATDPTGVRMADKLVHDIPAAIQYILETTGQATLDAVGHSMGGVLLTLHTLTTPTTPLRRLVTIGSPLALDKGTIPLVIRNQLGELIARQLTRVPLKLLSSRLSRLIPTRLLQSHFEPALAERSTVRQTLTEHVSDVFGSELQELVRWITTADFAALMPADATRYHTRLPIPTLMLVGANDGLTTARAVTATHAAVGSASTTLHVIGRQSGYEFDYRHFDVLVGGRIGSEITPLVSDWLEGERINPPQPRAERRPFLQRLRSR